jgi:hypothetical protein
MKVSRGLLAVVVLTLAVPVCAQSLGDLAKQEADRRKAAQPATKVYTDDDLKKMRAPGDTTTPEGKPEGKDEGKDAKDPNAKAAKDPKDAKDKDAADDKAKMDEAAWRAKITAAREDVRKGEAFRDALQSQINALTADFSARDDPYQRAQIADQRQKALAELDHVNQDIEKAKKSITDIEEDARRANVPPGWLR